MVKRAGNNTADGMDTLQSLYEKLLASLTQHSAATTAKKDTPATTQVRTTDSVERVDMAPLLQRLTEAGKHSEKVVHSSGKDVAEAENIRLRLDEKSQTTRKKLSTKWAQTILDKIKDPKTTFTTDTVVVIQNNSKHI